MGIRVNREFLPIKAHYFLFFAALGPILPQVNVFGRQLGVSPGVMGMVTGVLPLLWAAAKPSFGYIVDYFTNQRKLIFMSLIALMTISHCCLWFLPKPIATETLIEEHIYRLNNTVYIKHINNTTDESINKYICHWNSLNRTDFELYITDTEYVNTLYVNKDINNNTCEELNMKYSNFNIDIVCEPDSESHLVCKDVDLVINDKEIVDLIKNKQKRDINDKLQIKVELTKEKRVLRHVNDDKNISNTNINENSNLVENVPESDAKNDTNIVVPNLHENNYTNLVEANLHEEENDTDLVKENLYKDNDTHLVVPNSHEENDSFKIVDVTNTALVNGESLTKTSLSAKDTNERSFYASSTFWGYVVFMCIGAVAFNVANCIGDAVCFNVLGPDRGNKYGYQRAWGTAGYGITALVGGWLVDVASKGHIKDFTPAFILAIVFTVFDIIACRTLKLPKLSSPSDSGEALKNILKLPRVLIFIIFAMIIGIFDSFIIYYMFWYLEELAESTGHMDSIKLLEGIIVAAQSLGELFFFFFSGKILKRWGHGITMTFCLFCYGVRLALVSFITHPWHLVFIEIIMQGPTYALCYATIVGYAAEVAPEGYSATVQGIVAGMDDGIGFSLGSVLGGVLYSYLGGCDSFRLMALIALLTSFIHALLHKVIHNRTEQDEGTKLEEIPESEKMLDNDGPIYRDTVVPLSTDQR